MHGPDQVCMAFTSIPWPLTLAKGRQPESSDLQGTTTWGTDRCEADNCEADNYEENKSETTTVKRQLWNDNCEKNDNCEVTTVNV